MTIISKTLIEALKRYFNVLSKFGYKNYTDTKDLIVLTHLEELLSEAYIGFLTESDYKAIVEAIYCMAKRNCMIDYPSFPTFDSLFKEGDSELYPRADEDNALRICECETLRVKM